MSIETGLQGAIPANALPTPEQDEVFAAVLPVLAEMRANRRIAQAAMPEDQEVLPGQSVFVEPYYDAATDDHRKMGHWSVTAKKPGEEKPSFRAMVSAQPNFAVKRLGAEHTTTEDIAQVVSVLGLLVASEAVREKPKLPQKTGIARWLGKRATRR